MATFKILQLSDLHIGKYPNRIGVPENLAPLWAWLRHRLSGNPAPFPAAGFLSTHDPDVLDAAAAFAATLPHIPSKWDVVLVSGDVVASGSGSNLNLSSHFLDSTPVRGHQSASRRATLQAARCDIVLLPGNHDHFTSAPFCLPGNRSFDSQFGLKAGFRSPVSKFQDAEVVWKKSKSGPGLAIIAADFSLQSTDIGQFRMRGALPVPGHFGQGRANPGPLAKLRQLTIDTRKNDPDALVIWTIHFDPAATDDLLELLDSKHFEAECKDLDIPLVLCGHTHEHRDYRTGNTRVLVCGTTAQFYVGPKGQNELQEITIDWDGAKGGPPKLTLRRFRFSRSANSFVPIP